MEATPKKNRRKAQRRRRRRKRPLAVCFNSCVRLNAPTFVRWWEYESKCHFLETCSWSRKQSRGRLWAVISWFMIFFSQKMHHPTYLSVWSIPLLSSSWDLRYSSTSHYPPSFPPSFLLQTFFSLLLLCCLLSESPLSFPSSSSSGSFPQELVFSTCQELLFVFFNCVLI